MSKLDVLHSPSVGFSGFSTPPYSQSVFPNYKLEIQDGRGRGGGGLGVEAIRLESFGFSPTNCRYFIPDPLLPPPVSPCGLLVGGL